MELIRRYFPAITAGQEDRFMRFAEELKRWNERINLISRKDAGHLSERHVLHSLAIARFVEFKSAHAILDAGTGGGFPGIPLAIMFPEARFILMDSIGKKIRAVSDMAVSLGLENVECIHGRVEQYPGKVDFVVARAVTELSRFCQWIDGKLNPPTTATETGLYYLKGGDLQPELAGFRNYRIYDLAGVFEESFFQTKKLLFLPASVL